MSAVFEQICSLYERQCELRRETSYRWLTPVEISELIQIQVDLDVLWHRRQSELAGASEAQRRSADAVMRSHKKAAGTDARWQ